MKVLLVHIDGALPNLALMKLGHFHRSQGDDVTFTSRVERDLFDPEFDRVYASAIFEYSADRVRRVVASWPQAIIGGFGDAINAEVAKVFIEESSAVIANRIHSALERGL